MNRNRSANSYAAVSNQSWWSFLTENRNTKNVLIPCAVGIMLLMCALASAIYVGTSALIPFEPYTDPSYLASIISGTAMVFIFCSLFGGYLASYGFLHILQDSRKTESTSQE